MRQQFANEMMEQYAEDELGYVLAEALGLDGGNEPPARLHTNQIHKGLFLSDDDE
jgi:hypothetical protein